MSGHAHAIDPRKEALTYTVILACLLVFTFITVGVSYIHFGSSIVNAVVAVVIATIKASLVALFFMHLRHDKPINALIFLISVFMLALFLITCYVDYSARDSVYPPNYKPTASTPNAVTVPPPASPDPETH